MHIHCNTLQHNATQCNTLQTQWNTLEHTATDLKVEGRMRISADKRRRVFSPHHTHLCVVLYCSVLQSVAECCRMLQCVASLCVLQYVTLSSAHTTLTCVLQCVAVCSSVLQCVAVFTVRCITLCVAVCYTALHHFVINNTHFALLSAAQYCSVLQRVATCCSVLQHAAACCSVLQRVAICHSVFSVLQRVLQRVAYCCSVLQSSSFSKCSFALWLDFSFFTKTV